MTNCTKRGISKLLLIFLVTCFLPAGLVRAEVEAVALNEYLLYFFDGRMPPDTRLSSEWNWFDDGAMKLGIGTYVVHQGSQAVIYDTFTSTEQAQFVRDYLTEMGISDFKVVHSHWHLDHIAGDSVFLDATFVASSLTRNALASQAKAIEDGSLWGAPAIERVILPDVVFDDGLEIYVGDIRLQLRRIDIHSQDSTVIYLPDDMILLAGDTLEDTLTYVVEVESLPAHIQNLRDLRQWEIDRIYPNHGNPETIRSGGYKKTFIDSTIEYLSFLLARSSEDSFLESTVEEALQESLTKGWVTLFEPYREVHTENLNRVREYWGNRAIPEF